MDDHRLARTFDVLGHVATHGPAGLSEIAAALGLPLSSTHDLLHAMVDTQLLHVDGRRYGVGPRAIRSALAVLDSVTVQQAARRHLEELVESVGFDVFLATRAGSRVIYTSRFAGTQPTPGPVVELGRSLRLHSTAVGKLFAAFDARVYRAMMDRSRRPVTRTTRTTQAQLDADLGEIRRRRLSVSRGESFDGILGLATPVFAGDGSLTAAVHVSVRQPAPPSARLGTVVARMARTSRAIEADLCSSRPVDAHPRRG